MTYSIESRIAVPSFWILALCLLLSFGAFFKALGKAWLAHPEFSHGVLVPFVVGYLLWRRRKSLQAEVTSGRSEGLTLVILGCGLHIFGALSGTLLLLGAALVVTILGTTLYLWGPQCTKTAAAPVALLMFMIPLPAYVTGELSWSLQGFASTVSSAVLRFLGTPVLQEGNILRIANYALEVKQACSGSRSIFALTALALLLGLSATRKWWIRVLLVTAAPVLAVSANIVRIVGTGLIANQWGILAADESLHATWGIVVFMIAVLGLFGFLRLLRCLTHEHVS
jgi:exosortase